MLSPLLLNVYVNELSELLNKSGFGGNMGGTIVNHMLFADDIMYCLAIVIRTATAIKYM